MKHDATFQAIAALDLEPIKAKLMHHASGEGWSRARADAMASEYRRFLYLTHAFPDEHMAPTVDVDTFWHYHILDTAKYAADCAQLFGYFLHHYPYLGMDGGDEGAEQRGGARMRELYEATFGEDYIRPEAYGSAAYCMFRPGSARGKGAQAAYCMLDPDQKVAQGAYCMVRPGSAAGAYCMYRPGQAMDQRTAAAYCMYRPGSAKPGAAERGNGVRKQADAELVA